MQIELPNVRTALVPDPGYIVVDFDLAGADAQVVAWEAEDEELKAAFRNGLKVHEMNATAMLGDKYTKLSKDDPLRKKYYKDNKQAVHLTNYAGSARTCASTLGWTTIEAERFQKRWFSLHPGIKNKFHARIERSLAATRSVANRFGFSVTFFDRMESIFPEAVAWVPQSSVALTTFKGAIQVRKSGQFPYIRWLAQVHDSLVLEIPVNKENDLPLLLKALEVPIPYDDPLTIRWEMKTSRKSWGDCG